MTAVLKAQALLPVTLEGKQAEPVLWLLHWIPADVVGVRHLHEVVSSHHESCSVSPLPDLCFSHFQRCTIEQGSSIALIPVWLVDVNACACRNGAGALSAELNDHRVEGRHF